MNNTVNIFLQVCIIFLLCKYSHATNFSIVSETFIFIILCQKFKIWVCAKLWKIGSNPIFSKYKSSAINGVSNKFQVMFKVHCKVLELSPSWYFLTFWTYSCWRMNALYKTSRNKYILKITKLEFKLLSTISHISDTSWSNLKV